MKAKSRTNLGFGLACLLILLISIISLISIKNYISISEHVVHNLNVQTELERLSSDFISAKASVRGFHIMGHETFLKEYADSHEAILNKLKNLKALSKKQKEQLKELSTLEQIISRRFAFWDENIGIRKKTGLSAIPDLVKRSQLGRQLDEEFNESIQKLKQEEETFVNHMTLQLTRFSRSTVVFISLGSIVAILLVILAAYIVKKDFRLRIMAEQETANFFAVSLDLLCISGMDGLFKKISPAWVDVLGYSMDELFKIPLMDLVHPDDIPRTLLEIEKQSKGDKVLFFENRWRRKDGSYADLSWKSVPLGDVMYGAARDITQQKTFERQLIAAEKASQASARAKSEFLANMSHEIRTPLNGIIGVTDLLDHTALDIEQKKFTSTIRNSGEMLLKIINEILDFSKIEAGKMELEFHDFELQDLIENQISLVGVQAHAKNLILSQEIDPNIPKRFNGDSGRINQILLNLLNNAIKFTDHGEVKLKSEMLENNKDVIKLKFSVQDTGIGMSEVESQKIFRPFSQADGSTARKFGGTGLGLSISKKLVEMMAGEIGVDSEIGKGSTFWFTISLKLAPEQTQSTLRQAIESLKSARVLVAEDNQVNQMIIKKMLEKLGHSVHVVSNGQEAVNVFKNAEYDLILMDHHMPVMDGMEATSLIRKMENGEKRIPILAFTANVLEESQIKFKDSGADDFIMKPVTLAVLSQTLSKWIPRT
jgi:PAS domain S-box-containing protein